ncbi:flavin reductase family protein [Streptomyces sp. NPDC087901]|uniref:flavin reductase family protein n=1 Tax=unclassified Streptomyces TaxID=2593676 RepID=UPI00342A5085
MIETVTAQQTGTLRAGLPAEVREATHRMATGVSVLTCGGPETVEGVTVSTLALASLKPPVVSVSLREGSRGLHSLLTVSHFVVNTLAGHQDEVARHFASRERSSGTSQLPDGSWEGLSSQGIPLLHDAVAWLECRVTRTLRVGDHRVVFAGVTGSAHRNATPLVGLAGKLYPGPFAHDTSDSERDQ